jgi:adenylylsulfate kinase
MNLKSDLTWHEGKVTYQERCHRLNQRGLVVWFTGLSGAGKSTLAVEVEQKLHWRGYLSYRLDGDNVRQGLNSDLGFSAADRDENIRRVAEVAALFKDAGLIVLVAFISPFRRMREFARRRAGQESFLEVYCKADLETLRSRDVKGLYTRAQQRQIAEFTGISSPYEEPVEPDLCIDTGKTSIETATRLVLEEIIQKL